MREEREVKNETRLQRACVPGTSESYSVASGLYILQAQDKSHNKGEKEAPPMKLRVGNTAPDFTLFAFDGKELKKVSLQDYRGKKNVALAFFVFVFTGG
jgi:hypothetical protein